MGFLNKLFSKQKNIDLNKLDNDLKTNADNKKDTDNKKVNKIKNQDKKIKKINQVDTKNKGNTVIENMITKDNSSVNTSGNSVIENIMDPSHRQPHKPLEDPKHKGSTLIEKMIDKTPENIKKEDIPNDISQDISSKKPMPIDTTPPTTPAKVVKTGFFSSLLGLKKKSEESIKNIIPGDKSTILLSENSSVDELEVEKKKITQELDLLTKDIEAMIKDMEDKTFKPSGSKENNSPKKVPAVKTVKSPVKKSVRKPVPKKESPSKPVRKTVAKPKKVVVKKSVKKAKNNKKK